MGAFGECRQVVILYMGMKMEKIIKEQLIIKGRVRVITTKLQLRNILRISEWTNNLIVSGTNTGKNLIAKKLAGVNTYSLNLTHADIGTGTNPPDALNTQLQIPIARAPVSSQVVSNNIATLRFFFPDALLPNGIYTELGTFVDGAAGISTGKLFNRLLFGIAYAKAAGEDSTFEVEITIN